MAHYYATWLMFSKNQLAGLGLGLLGGLLAQPVLAQNQPGLPASAQAIGLASDSLTLGGTVQAVLDANPGIANLTELANAAGSRLSQSQAGYLPQITGSAVYTRLDPVSTSCMTSASERPAPSLPARK